MSSIAESIAFAAPSFTGRLLRPTDPGYDDVRRVHNGLIDKRPAVIARCHGAADVVDAVQLARKLGLAISVRGGGHNVAGRATIDDGLMIDLSPMKGIHVDATARTARAQGGVLWKEFNRETQLHGLATTGGVVGSTGIAGLTLGGGLGWLMPKYGLALDNLRVRRPRHGRRHAWSAPAPTSTRICSGRFAAAAATSASRRRSNTRSTASAR